jgi:hypothetical protein
MLTADLSKLGFWSWWITPESEPKRYDTRFFVTVVDRPASLLAHHDEHETVGSIWVTPKTALAAMEAGTFFLAPPTFLTLRELAFHASPAAVFAEARRRVPQPILPRLHRLDQSSWQIVLPGHASYPTPTPMDGATGVIIENGRCRAEGGP